MQTYNGRVVTLHDQITFLLSLTATAFAIIAIMNIVASLTKYSGYAFWLMIIGYITALAIYQERKRLTDKSAKKKDDNQ